ncbi:MAG: VCBS repeat-containing protein [Deltaproteobacteria bacterium]|nr:VCBS repeat-containing protein [Deltaproteobacteria bacterium]
MSRRKGNFRQGLCYFLALLLGLQGFIPGVYSISAWAQAPDPNLSRFMATAAGLGSLAQVQVPQPPGIDTFLLDKNAAIRLGKALFWDMQVGSDGQACGTCHFHAGVDNRVKNQINPGTPGQDTVFGNNPFTGLIDFPGFGPNATLTADVFPLHLLSDTADNESPVLRDTNDVIGSQGIFKVNYGGSNPLSLGDEGVPVPDSVFKIAGVNTRRVTGRNTPATINAVFNFSCFWDGRANMIFNGVNTSGPYDADAGIYVNTGGVLQRQVIRIPLAALASQAVGPPLSTDEMSFIGRTFPEIGRKLIDRQPLAFQKVHPQDSVLGTLSPATLNPDGTVGGAPGLNTTYRAMIQAAFHPDYWNSSQSINGYTQMETNFSLFFGLAIQFYEATQVSNRAPFDHFMEGDNRVLTERQINGLNLFVGKGACVLCHAGPELTDSSVALAVFNPSVPGLADGLIELMAMEDGSIALYDGPFHNNGVRPTAEDLGRGGTDSFLNPLTGQKYPLSFSRLTILKALGLLPADLASYVPTLEPGIPTSVRVIANGEFKTPGLRNVELTGPYMHNGAYGNLKQVVEFYDRGGDFLNFNMPDSDPMPPLIGFTPEEESDLIAFLLSLTDERVKFEKAPFDHPQLFVPNAFQGGSNLPCLSNLKSCDYQEIPAVGALGRPAANLGPLGPFLGLEQIPLQVGLEESQTSPRPVGTALTFRAVPVGGSGSYEFEFLLNGVVVRPYSTLASWTWATAGAAAGAYTVTVQARNLGSTAPFEARFEMPFVLGIPPATGVTITPSPASPQPAGTLATFEAAASGASGSFEYQFLLSSGGGPTILMRPYSALSSWTWNTAGYGNGTYTITVQTRSTGSTGPFEASAAVAYDLAPATQIGVTLSASPPSPSAPGTPVTFTATGQGGSGNYEYQFWLYQNNTWTVVQPYSGTSTWIWNPTSQDKGDHYVRVEIRNAGSVAEYEGAATGSYRILGTSSADFDGDGKTDIAVWRPGDGNWYIVNSGTGAMTVRQWGTATDLPVARDYDGDGKTDIAVWRPGDGNWYIVNSGTGAVTVRQWGDPTDRPLGGDFDGDGKADIAVWRPGDGNWYVLRSSDGGATATQWGTNGDIPISQK